MLVDLRLWNKLLWCYGFWRAGKTLGHRCSVWTLQSRWSWWRYKAYCVSKGRKKKLIVSLLDVFSQAEEINLYEFPHKNYGFPYCFTEYDLHPYTENAKGKGAQWVSYCVCIYIKGARVLILGLLGSPEIHEWLGQFGRILSTRR